MREPSDVEPEAASPGGPGVAIRVTPSRESADECGVVLAAADIPHWLRHRLDGWALLVSPADAPRALATLEAYERENRTEAAAVAATSSPTDAAVTLALVVALLLLGFFAVTGPAGRSTWFERGAADSARIVGGEWWRAVTARTLHADGPHVLGNAVAAALLLPAVFVQLGPGVGLWLVLLAGAGGNLLTAFVHGGEHLAVGASTAIFAAIGILAAVRVVRPERSRARTWIVVAACLALLALLGAAPGADLLAHLFGLVVGAVLGLAAALARRTPSSTAQWLLVAAAGGAVAVAWRLALT